MDFNEYDDLLSELYNFRIKEEKYRWHDLRKDPNDLPEKANDDSKSGYSKEVLIISSLFNEVWIGYMKLSDKKWFDSVDGELLSKPIMWKYIELPDENNISKIVKMPKN